MKKNTFKPAVCSFFFFFIVEMAAIAHEGTIPVKVGVVLDDYDNWVGEVWLSCMTMSLSDFYASRGHHYKTRLVLIARDSKKDVVGAAAAAFDLIQNVKVQAIIGPSTSTQAKFVIQLGEKAQLPIISFSVSSPLGSIQSPYFFQATQNDKAQVMEISSIAEEFGCREAVIIYVDNEYGFGIIPYLINALQAVDTQVSYLSAISPSASDDQLIDELYKLKIMQNRFFIVHMLPSLGVRLFTKAKEVGMMSEGFVWVMTDGMTNLMNSLDTSIFDSIHHGVVILGVRPYVPKTNGLENFRNRWLRKFHQDNPGIAEAELNIYGLWAYDVIIALAMAVEKVVTSNFWFQKPNISRNCTHLKLNGLNLAQALSNISFKGLTGDFLFVNQQLQPSAFQIVNIKGVGPRQIDIWTPAKGIPRKLHGVEKSPSKPKSLAPIEQPAGNTFICNDTDFKDRKRLIIGVPVKKGFREFVNVKVKNTTIEGFCIALFDEAMKDVRHARPYCYYPYNKTYEMLVNEVFLREFDGAVGDISILDSRLQYVDFTWPCVEYSSVIQMIVASKGDSGSWLFLFRPLTWQLWLIIFFFPFFIGFVVWVLERGQNQEFQGSLSSQFGTTFWFAFSIMVFAHRERITRNSTRIVVLVSCFTVLFLTQSYSAALSSYLTYQQIVGDVNEMVQKNLSVGYQDGSFIYHILRGWGFSDSQIKKYVSAEQCRELLSNGSIQAALDEMPYANIILKNNTGCKYKLVQIKLEYQQVRTHGFGFAFPKGSPLAANVSKAILELMETHRLKNLQTKWFGEDQDSCSSAGGSGDDFNRLGLENFWVLFVFATIPSVIALFSHISHFDRNLFTKRDSHNNVPPESGTPSPPPAPDDLVYPYSSTGERRVSFPEHDVPNANEQTLEDSSVELTIRTY